MSTQGIAFEDLPMKEGEFTLMSGSVFTELNPMDVAKVIGKYEVRGAHASGLAARIRNRIDHLEVGQGFRFSSPITRQTGGYVRATAQEYAKKIGWHPTVLNEHVTVPAIIVYLEPIVGSQPEKGDKAPVMVSVVRPDPKEWLKIRA